MKIPSMTEASEWLLKKILIPKKQEIENLEDTIRNHAARLALDDVGLLEGPVHNRSNWIDKINKEMNLPMGSAYCLSALFVRVFIPLCKIYSLKIPFIPNGSTQKFYDSVPKEYLRGPEELCQRGDIVILQDRKNPSLGHAYLVIRDDVIQDSVEYNTNIKGSPYGDGCYELKRTRDGTTGLKYRGAIKIIDWILNENKK